MKKLIISATLIVASLTAIADTRFDAEIQLMDREADECIHLGQGRGSKCDSFKATKEYITGGSMRNYMQYHDNKGDLDDLPTLTKFGDMLTKVKDATTLILNTK